MGLLRAGLLGGPMAVAQRGATFWVAAAALLAADLEKLPRSFAGTILVHPYLTDFALALRRLDMLERLLAACHQARPRARVGFHTNMAADAINALHLLDARVDEIAILSAPRACRMAETVAALRTAGPGPARTVVVEVGQAPSLVHRVASQSPALWTVGADAIVVGAQADPDVAIRRRLEVKEAWSAAFPGLEMPELVL